MLYLSINIFYPPHLGPDRRAERLRRHRRPVARRQSEAVRLAGGQRQSGGGRRGAERQRARAVRSAARRGGPVSARGERRSEKEIVVGVLWVVDLGLTLRVLAFPSRFGPVRAELRDQVACETTK